MRVREILKNSVLDSSCVPLNNLNHGSSRHFHTNFTQINVQLDSTYPGFVYFSLLASSTTW
jgi:hypothetical protein